MRLAWVTCLLCLLAAYRSLAQDVAVNVTLRSNLISFAVIPDETYSLTVISDYQLSIPTISVLQGAQSDLNNFLAYDCMTTCSINVTGSFSAPVVVVGLEFSARNQDGDLTQVLNVTIKQSLNVSCQTYPNPIPFAGSTSYQFTCTPPSELNVTRVVWRRFYSEDEVEQFQMMPDNSGLELASNGVNITVNGTNDETLTLFSLSSVGDVAFFYVPSFEISGGPTEIPAGETSVFVFPSITTMMPEFSYEVLLNGDLHMIKCETNSYPPARTVWTLRSEDYVDGVDVSTLKNSTFALNNLGSEMSRTLTIDGALNLTNLQYNDDGNFTCVTSNRYGSDAQWTRLRVKSPLRPLWPALGIIGVAIIVGFFMTGSTVAEKAIERHKRAQVNRADTNSVDYSTEHGHRLTSVSRTDNGKNNAHVSKGKDSHSAVKRLSSAKPLLEETTTTL